MTWHVRFLMDGYYEGRKRKVGEVFESKDLRSIIDLEKQNLAKRIPAPEEDD